MSGNVGFDDDVGPSLESTRRGLTSTDALHAVTSRVTTPIKKRTGVARPSREDWLQSLTLVSVMLIGNRDRHDILWNADT